MEVIANGKDQIVDDSTGITDGTQESCAQSGFETTDDVDLHFRIT